MTRPSTVRGVLAVLLAAVALLCGCSGVPSSSAPEIIQSVGNAGPQPVTEISPQPDAEPRAIVAGFLSSNASQDAHHLAARNFLTPEANNRWSDTTATIVDSLQIGNPDDRDRVTVTGQLIGHVDASGLYTPSQVVGGGGVSASFTYTLRQVDGQWRIDAMQPGGLLVTYQQFQDYYQQRVIYFFDQDEQRLVPDPRFTTLQDGPLLASWLMAQLTGGVRPELQAATTTELPNQTDPRRVTVTAGTPMRLEIPGASQLNPATRDKLAAQVALTLTAAVGSGQLTITDGGRPVDIDRAGGAVFNATSFQDSVEPANRAPQLYWLNLNGLVVSADTGKPVAGTLGNGDYHLDAVALGRVDGNPHILAAGNVPESGRHRLYVGTDVGPLHATKVSGSRLSRPAWVPYRDEVWVGDGRTLYRTTSEGSRVSEVPIAAAGGGQLTGDVVAVRFSPEGSRVALVMRSADGVGQLWLGSVVRTTDSVQVANLVVISPGGTNVTDVGWNDELKLFATGSNVGGSAHIYEVQCDGSLWTPRTTANLPDTPDSITVAEGEIAAVSADKTIWLQDGASWDSPSRGPTSGTNPVYLE